MQQKIVSSEDEKLILVDEADNALGFMSKSDCHDGDGVLHRAFSLFIFDDKDRLLLQRRGSNKRLWPGYWSNSCCSHPREGESMTTATRRRLEEELGIDIELEFVYRFQYQAAFGEAGSENELCSVYLGRCVQDVKPNQSEIDEIRYLSAEELKREMESRPGEFTPWFRQEWNKLTEEHAGALHNYLSA